MYYGDVNYFEESDERMMNKRESKRARKSLSKAQDMVPADN